MEQESNTFKDKLKAWGRFFISPYFIRNICIYMAAILLFFLLVVQGLKWYTHHNEKISVPSVEGLPIPDAMKIIRERGLVPEVSDSTYNAGSRSAKPGHIIEHGQLPPAGYQVKKGRKIYLTYLAYTKEPATMPAIKGESVETAKSLLMGVGLVPGKITERESPHKNLVLEARFNGAQVSKGKQLHKGDIIDLIIGKGDDDNRTTPKATPEDSLDDFNMTTDPDDF